jgi:hypothetical protein
MTNDVEPAVTRDIPAALEVPLDLKSSSLDFSEPAPSKDAAMPASCPSGADHLDHVPCDVRENDLPGKVAQPLIKVSHHYLFV